MKLTSVEIHPDGSSQVAVLSFRDPKAQNPYNVKGITGLDAEEIVPRAYGSSGAVKFYNLALAKRTIVIRIGLNPDFSTGTYSDLRDALYKMIASSRTGKVQIQFKNDTVAVAAVSGSVAKVEAPQFEKTQEVHITVNCDDPMLKAVDPTVVPIAGLDPALTVITDDVSTAPHGLTFDVTYTAPTASIQITDPDDPTWVFEVIPGGGFLVGDVLHFSSEFNNKALHLIRGAATVYLADVISPGSVWPIIFPGVNNIALSNAANLGWTDISYYQTYWGV